MLKYLLAAGALVVAGVPAAVGLSGNASFDRDVPVRVPEQAQTVAPTPSSVDDDGTPDQGPGDVGTAEAEPGDDHGGLTPRDDRTEAGDDRDGRHGRHHDGADDDATEDATEDDGGHHGRHHGDDDAADHDSTDDDSGHHGGGDDDRSGRD
jgi:hypothetical protein